MLTPEIPRQESPSPVEVSFEPVALSDLSNAKRWNAVLASTGFCPFLYAFTFARFQFLLQSAAAEKAADYSTILKIGGKPVAVWPIFAILKDRAWRLETYLQHIHEPLFTDTTTEKQRRQCMDLCFSELKKIAGDLSIPYLQCASRSVNTTPQTWTRKVLSMGAEQTVAHELYVLLSQNMDTMRSQFRRSYRSLFRMAESLWTVEVITNENPSTIQLINELHELHELHIQVAGCVTRPTLTWDAQAEAISQGEAFAILLRDRQNSSLVGGALFHHTANEATYNVGVYDRSLFDKPIGHLAQYAAIQHMIEIGLKSYYLGQRFYPVNRPVPSEKEMQISYFKEGFANSNPMTLQVKVPTENLASK